ncbi:MAG: hypothetical protein ACTSPQ_21465 [Candidatus Helarchaeota archaeon]
MSADALFTDKSECEDGVGEKAIKIAEEKQFNFKEGVIIKGHFLTEEGRYDDDGFKRGCVSFFGVSFADDIIERAIKFEVAGFAVITEGITGDFAEVPTECASEHRAHPVGGFKLSPEFKGGGRGREF